jgi:imidazolonepropionase
MLTLRGPSGPRRGAALNELHVISDGALLIRNGVVAEVGSTRRLENLAAARGAVEINAAGRVVMPGFVDAHTHLMFPPPGAEADEERALQTVRTSSSHRLTGKARALLDAMARQGTTTVEIKTGGGEDESSAHKLLRVLGALSTGPIGAVPTLLCRFSTPAGAERLLASLPRITRRTPVRFADFIWSAEPDLQPFYPRYLEAVRAMRIGRKVHADDSAPGVAIEMGLLYSATSIDHLEYATGEQASALALTGVMVTLLPCAALIRGGPQAKARAFIDGGAPVALGTNFNAAHTPASNMQTAVALACIELKMSVEEAISAATINAAYAIGLGSQTGSLEWNKTADVIVLNVSDYRDLAHNLGGNLVRQTIRQGHVIYEEGKVGPRLEPPRSGL